MKIVFLAGLICVLVLISVVEAVPTGEQEAVNPFNVELAAENPKSSVILNRQKRYTCNVLKSPAACTAHCWALGRWRGGYCSYGTCICRQ